MDHENPLAGPVGEIQKAGERAATLTRQLLDFSRKRPFQPRILELNRTIANIEKMLRRVIGEDLDLVIHLDPEPGMICADPGQVEQALLNLAVNARDAMPRGGRLSVETLQVRITEEKICPSGFKAVVPGDYLVLRVRDTGQGISEEIRARMFEPFFTTKEAGKGTGLGLSTVLGIMEQCGGHIEVESDPGMGTMITLFWPKAREIPSEDPEKKEFLSTARGSEVVLLVEDEHQVRGLVRELLEAQGYTVQEADNGKDALQICTLFAGPIHLLLSDVVLPGLRGEDLAAQIRGLRPGIKALLMSGYLEEREGPRRNVEGGIAFIEKPFTPNQLAREVRRVLDGK
jgi:CheY-like chemotaxis protein